MREASYYHPDKGRLRCELCEYRCRIAEGHSGACRVRGNIAGKLYTANYGQVATATLGPIEQTPFYHFFPATRALHVGSSGGNAHSIHGLAATASEERRGREVDPDKLVEVGIKQRARGLVWDYSEPIIWFEYVLACTKLADARGMYTAVRTDGYISDEPLKAIGHYLDGWAVEIIGLSSSMYRRLRRAPRYEQILEATAAAQRDYKCHVEVSTPLYAGLNDDTENLSRVAEWICLTLGPQTPWQVSLAPSRELDLEGHAALERAQAAGLAAGLQFVYINEADQPVNTYCPNCQALVMSRRGDEVSANLTLGHCGRCDYNMNIRNTIFKV
jgi:pyruvate formate lyase activating enzyme